jgi:hypothetical protein
MSDDDKPPAPSPAERIRDITVLMHTGRAEDQQLYEELLPHVQELIKEAADEKKCGGRTTPEYYTSRGMSYADALIKANDVKRAKEREKGDPER